jgi:hypothetical protein
VRPCPSEQLLLNLILTFLLDILRDLPDDLPNIPHVILNLPTLPQMPPGRFAETLEASAAKMFAGRAAQV